MNLTPSEYEAGLVAHSTLTTAMHSNEASYIYTYACLVCVCMQHISTFKILTSHNFQLSINGYNV
jgi:hypothetical protein